MKIKFLVKPAGTDYEIGQIADFKTWVEQTYAEKYLREEWAERVPQEMPGTAEAIAPPIEEGAPAATAEEAAAAAVTEQASAGTGKGSKKK